MDIVGIRTDDNIIYKKIRTLHRSMMSRCYNPNSGSYAKYGGLGVTVADEWKNLRDFEKTIDKVEGFDLELLLEGGLQLDKDIKQSDVDITQRVYSVDTCTFVSPQENSSNRLNNKRCIGVSPDGEVFTFTNRERFCKSHDLNSRHAFSCLQGKVTHHKGWQFFYEDIFDPALVKLPKRVKGVDPKGNEYYFNNIAVFSKQHNLIAGNITGVLKGKNTTHKGWEFTLINEGFVIQ